MINELKLIGKVVELHYWKWRENWAFLVNFYFIRNQIYSNVEFRIKIEIDIDFYIFYFIISVRNMNRSSTSPFRGTAGSATRATGYESAEMLIRTLEQ